MIEPFPSSDGKHTVHVSAETSEELAELGPKAKTLYEKIIESYGNKAQMWKLAIDKEPARLKTARQPACRLPSVRRQPVGRLGRMRWTPETVRL